MIEADSDDENELNNAVLVPTSSEVRNIMTILPSHLDANSNGKMNNKMDDVEEFDAIKDNAKKISDYFPKTQ
ncbi:hypothetical protein TNCV_4197221 [Trichonephila clavipes]|nr:hypothetical protein TNCV_4197221 [Trichonephila clavipes]